MKHLRRVAPLIVSLGLLTTCLLACKKRGADASPRYRIDEIGLDIPKQTGWIQDPSVQWENSAQGGTVLRLVREDAVAGSPRIDVLLEAKSPTPTTTDQFMSKNLAEMGNLEAQGKIRILSVEQRETMVGDARAYTVRHEYSIGAGSSQASITQLSLFFVREGRGVAMTAAGRTELFHPVADSIDKLFASVRLTDVKASKSRKTRVDETRPKSLVEPIDLGTLGK